MLDCNGSGSNSGVIASVDWLVANAVAPAVANMSLGGGDSTALDNAVKAAINSGVTMVVAAGNSSANACSGSPNKVPEALTVGATESNDAMASYSNYGSCVDIFAPGSGITSAAYNNNSGTRVLSGTSMAAPHVAGAAALILSRGGRPTPAQIRNTLVAEASTNVLTGIKTGSPNVLLQVKSTESNLDQAPNANFVASCSALSCSFDASSASDDRGISSYAWQFGDGSSASGLMVSKNYAAASTYTVSLTVTDSGNQSAVASRSVTVSNPVSSSPCPDCKTVYSGTLSNGGSTNQPSSNGFNSAGGVLTGYLQGASGTDFDLALEKYSSGLFGGWTRVATAETNSTNETIRYNGSAGTYRWRISSYRGAGAYQLYVK